MEVTCKFRYSISDIKLQKNRAYRCFRLDSEVIMLLTSSINQLISINLFRFIAVQKSVKKSYIFDRSSGFCWSGFAADPVSKRSS